MNKILSMLAVLSAALLTGGGCGSENSDSITAEVARSIAEEAYVYGFPMVVSYKAMYQFAIAEDSPEYKGGFNQLACEARVYTPDDKAIVTPNADTPYCMFWGNMLSEPLVLTIPIIEPGRFFQVQLVDLYTHNFAYVSTVATGNRAGRYLIVGPDWEGEVPEGMMNVIHSETPYFFSVIRTQLFNPDDLAHVKKIQDGYGFQPLSVFLGEATPTEAVAIDFPEWREGAQFDVRFFDLFDFMLRLVDPVPEEQALMSRFAKIGVGSGDPFDIDNFSPAIAEALAMGVQDGFERFEVTIAEVGSDPLASAKIFGTRDFLQESARSNFEADDYYIFRAVAAHTGLYGNSGIEAVYPTYFVDSDQVPLDASANAYQITFPEGQLPPVSAFWSLTMYDGSTQLFIENPIDRYVVNSTMLDQFKRGDDDSITFYIQKESPGTALESNWLPAPDGPFYVTMRLYGPEPAVLEGEWKPPMIVRNN